MDSFDSFDSIRPPLRLDRGIWNGPFAHPGTSSIEGSLAVEALVAHDVRVLADPEEHRGLMLQHLVGVAHGERLQAGRVSAARPGTATTTGDGRGEFGMGGNLNEP